MEEATGLRQGHSILALWTLEAGEVCLRVGGASLRCKMFCNTPGVFQRDPSIDTSGSSEVAWQERICLQCKSCRFDSWVWKIPWRQAWQAMPEFWPGEAHGERSLVGYSPQGRKESDRSEATEHTHTGTPAFPKVALYHFAFRKNLHELSRKDLH